MQDRKELLQKVIKIKLLPTDSQEVLISNTMKEYIRTVNENVADMVTFNQFGKLSSANVSAQLPAALKTQSINDAKSIFRKYRKTGIEPILKKPIAIWNNENYRIAEDNISFPIWLNNKSKRITVKAIIPAETFEIFNNSKLGTMRITYKSHKMIAQIAVSIEEKSANGSNVMGVDLGLKCPAVCTTDTGRVRFIGNGRKNKYIRRHFKSKRRELGKSKKLNAIKKLDDKEQRIMKDTDHKISREIVNFAIQNNVSIIRMEQLANIRKSAKTSRKNNYNLHTWSFYRLTQYIEYKAKMAGISVEYVNPAYTSQICPKCLKIHKAKDRLYQCSCGYTNHRDLVGAINILSAPVANGNSLSA